MERVQKVAQAYSQTPWRKQMQMLGLFAACLVFIALIAGIYLNVTARAAITGREIQDLQSNLITLQQEISDLRAKLAFLTSASEMEKRARTSGYQPLAADQAQYFFVPEYPGRQPVILAAYSTPSLVGARVIPAEYTESLLDWIQKELNTTPFSTIIGF